MNALVRTLPMVLLLGCGGPEVGGPISSGLSVTYAANKDTWFHYNPAMMHIVDYGASRELLTTNTDNNDKAIFLQFPIALQTVCPTLMTATLTLTTAQKKGASAVEVRPILSQWTPGGSGAKAVMMCNLDTSNPSTFNAPGVGAVVDSEFVDTGCKAYSWDVTTAVQASCLSGNDYGFGVQATALNLPVNFHSNESPNVGARPKLIITY